SWKEAHQTADFPSGSGVSSVGTNAVRRSTSESPSNGTFSASRGPRANHPAPSNSAAAKTQGRTRLMGCLTEGRMPAGKVERWGAHLGHSPAGAPVKGTEFLRMRDTGGAVPGVHAGEGGRPRVVLICRAGRGPRRRRPPAFRPTGTAAGAEGGAAGSSTS